MTHAKLYLTITLLMVLTATNAKAAVPELPPDSIGADTVFVIRADAEHLTPDLLRAAAFAVLGDNAERATDFTAKFRDRYDQAIKAGVESITVIGTSSQRVSDTEKELNTDPNAPQRRTLNPPVIYFHLKAGGNAKAVEQAMTRDMPEKQRTDVRFEQDGNWVVMHEKNQTPPEAVDADRAHAFTAALKTIADSAVAFVVIPDVRMKKEMNSAATREGAAKFSKEALPLLSNSKWMTVAISLGNNPGLKMSANAADEKSATALRTSVDTALDDLKEQITNPGPNAGVMIFLGPFISPLLDNVRPRLNGTTVTAGLDGDPLNTVASLIVKFRANAAPPPASQPGQSAKPAGR